jgi:hypothetical protein
VVYKYGMTVATCLPAFQFRSDARRDFPYFMTEVRND